MSMSSTNRSGRQHLGTGSHSSPSSHNPLVNYEVAGIVRWLDVDLERIVVEVQSTNSRAGMFRGKDVTLDLEAARVRGRHLDELLPGTEVEVRFRLPRDLAGRIPDLLSALTVAAAPAV